MVGGSNFPEAKELLDHMGKNIVHCGAVGTGQVRMSYLSYSPQGYRFSHFNSILFFLIKNFVHLFCHSANILSSSLITSSLLLLISLSLLVKISEYVLMT